jgi:hypothetical protein
MNSDTLFLNGNLQAQATPASTASYTGIPAPDPTDMATKQCVLGLIREGRAKFLKRCLHKLRCQSAVRASRVSEHPISSHVEHPVQVARCN